MHRCTMRYVLCPLARARVVAALACEAFFLVMAWASPPLIIVIILFILIAVMILVKVTHYIFLTMDGDSIMLLACFDYPVSKEAVEMVNMIMTVPTFWVRFD